MLKTIEKFLIWKTDIGDRLKSTSGDKCEVNENGFCSRLSPNLWVCSREIGHEGGHHAHDNNGKCLEIWGRGKVKNSNMDKDFNNLLLILDHQLQTVTKRWMDSKEAVDRSKWKTVALSVALIVSNIRSTLIKKDKQIKKTFKSLENVGGKL